MNAAFARLRLYVKKISPKYPKYMPKICQRYAQDMSNICPRYPPRYPQDIPKIYIYIVSPDILPIYHKYSTVLLKVDLVCVGYLPVTLKVNVDAGNDFIYKLLLLLKTFLFFSTVHSITMKCCKSAEWIRYIAIYLGLPSKCNICQH